MTEEEELQELMDAADAERDELEGNEDDNEAHESSDEAADETGDTSDNGDDDDTNDDDVSGDDESGDTLDETDDSDAADDSDSGDNGQDNDNSEFEPVQVRVGDRTVEVNSREELLALASKGLDSVNIVPNKDSDNDKFMQQGGLTQDDLRVLIAAKGGDANAIAKLAQMGNVDLDEIDADDASSFQPTFNLQQQSEVEQVASGILKDEAHAAAFKQTLTSVPESFQQAITQDAGRLSAFSEHIRSGLAEKVIPMVQKELALRGGDFFQTYAKIGSEVAAGMNNRPADTTPNHKREMSIREKKMRDRANGSNRNDKKQNSESDVDEINSMSDADFEKLVSSTRK